MDFINLTQEQQVVHDRIKKFITKKKKKNRETNNTESFLLLGPGGTGKTTLMANVINDMPSHNFICCSFTNKATQIMRKSFAKHCVNSANLASNVKFMTIHKMLVLEPQEINDDLKFNFHNKKIEYLYEHDVIIFDECSVISSELYDYIYKSWHHIKEKKDFSLKFIFLGDYYQLPPVNEKISPVFENAMNNNWKISKLTQIKRSKSSTTHNLFENLLLTLEKIKQNDYEFIVNFPYNFIKDKNLFINNEQDFIDKYISCLNNDESVLILTYTVNNCNKINNIISEKIRSVGRKNDLYKLIKNNYTENSNEEHDKIQTKTQDEKNRKNFYLQSGDRCTVEKPIDILKLELIKNKYAIDEVMHYKILLNQSSGTLYNGETYDVISVENIMLIAQINYKNNYPIPAQLLFMKNTQTLEIIQTVHVDLETAYSHKNKYKLNKKFIKILYNIIPKFTYGYCMTIYKAQGSEYKNILISFSSIWWSIMPQNGDYNEDQIMMLYKTLYTALTRATDNIYILWF